MQRMTAVLLLFLFACAPARTVRINGQEVPYEEAARAEFNAAKASYDQGRYDAAAQQFGAFAQRYRDSELLDEAVFRRGQSLSKAGKLQEAQAALQEFLDQRPSSPFRNPAVVELASVQTKLGQPAPPLPPIDTSQMSDREKNQAAAALAESYARNGQWGEAMRWSARVFETAPPAERETRRKDYEHALEAAPAQDVARFVADLDRGSPAWPAAALKLARIQLHMGDRAHASDLARDVLASQSQGAYADGARAVQQAAQGSGVRPNLIGIVLPLTGDLKGFADQALNGIALTLDLQGRGKVQVEIVDTKDEPDAAAEAVEQLAQRGVIAILGPLGIAEGLAAATRAQQLGIPMISLSRADGLTALGEYIFRDMPTSYAQAKAVAEYAQKKLNAKSFGILQPDSAYGDEMAHYFWDAVDAGGSEVRAFEHYPLRTTTFKPFVQRMVGRSPADVEERQQFSQEAEKITREIRDPYRRRKALSQLRNQQAPIVDFDAIFIPDAARTVRLIAPAIAAEDVITTGCDTRELEVVKRTTKNEQLRTVQLLGTSLWDSPDLVDERSGVARYVQCSIFVDVFFANSERPATKKFVDDFGSAYKRAPGFLEAHAFDAAGILKRTIEERRPQSRDELRAMFAGMGKPFEGASGDTVFGRDREAQKPFFWLWINRGSIVEFDPEGPPPVPPAAPVARR